MPRRLKQSPLPPANRTQTSPDQASTAGTLEHHTMRSTPTFLKRIHYTPYPGAEPIPDAVWLCCGCKRKWLTKEMGSVCVGCSHEYGVVCCELAGCGRGGKRVEVEEISGGEGRAGEQTESGGKRCGMRDGVELEWCYGFINRGIKYYRLVYR
jgi:hypothetical protein